MKHSGKALRAGLKLIFWTLVLLLALLASGVIARYWVGLVGALAGVLTAVWVLFTAFTLYFFRDPEPNAPTERNVVVAPGQGKVDLIDETTEAEIMGGRCQRISIFLSVIDVHVQRAPIAGEISYLKHTDGQFLSATGSDCGKFNENVLIGFQSTAIPGQKIALRLIAGLIARRIIPWVTVGETVPRSERISLIQFGSRCDLYLPLTAKIRVKLGDRVTVGETVVAELG